MSADLLRAGFAWSRGIWVGGSTGRSRPGPNVSDSNHWDQAKNVSDSNQTTVGGRFEPFSTKSDVSASAEDGHMRVRHMCDVVADADIIRRKHSVRRVEVCDIHLRRVYNSVLRVPRARVVVEPPVIHTITVQPSPNDDPCFSVSPP